MSPNKALTTLLLLGAAVVSAPFAKADTFTLNFDDVSLRPYASSAISSAYDGLNFTWNNFLLIDGTDYANSGYQNAAISADNVIYNGHGGAASIVFNTTLDVDSLYLTAVWNNNLSVTIVGKKSGLIVDSLTYVVSTTSASLINLNFTGIDELDFVSSGGTVNPSYAVAPGTHFALDNLTLTTSATISPTVSPSAVPEPGSYALMGAGSLLGLAWLRRRRK